MKDNLEFLDQWISDWIDILDRQGVCPYAKKTLETNKVKTKKVPGEDLYDFWNSVSEECENWTDQYHIVIVAMNTNEHQITAQQLQGGIDSLNSNLNLRNKKLWLMCGLRDTYTMVFIQDIEKIDDASKVLESKNYYADTHPFRFKKNILARRKLRNKLSRTT